METKSGKVRGFQDLTVWHKAQQTALQIYKHTKNYPSEEKYGMVSQMRRAAVSVAANIAEGSKRASTKDLCHFLSIADGSNEEVKCLLLLSRDLHYISVDIFEKLFQNCDMIGAMIHGLIRSLQSS